LLLNYLCFYDFPTEFGTVPCVIFCFSSCYSLLSCCWFRSEYIQSILTDITQNTIMLIILLLLKVSPSCTIIKMHPFILNLLKPFKQWMKFLLLAHLCIFRRVKKHFSSPHMLKFAPLNILFLQNIHQNAMCLPRIQYRWQWYVAF
jgi:hypothetical protein